LQSTRLSSSPADELPEADARDILSGGAELSRKISKKRCANGWGALGFPARGVGAA
jgi:hypothetical protein